MPVSLTGYFEEGYRCVSGDGTSFLTDLAAGDRVRIGKSFNTVREVISNTALVLENDNLQADFFKTLYRVDNPGGDCLSLGNCFFSDSIDYKLIEFAGQLNAEKYRAVIGGNKAPTISPAIASPRLVFVTYEAFPGSSIILPTVQFGYAEGRVLNFVANASDPDSNDELTYKWLFQACASGPLCVGDNAVDFEISGVDKESVEYRYFHRGRYVVNLTVTDSEGASTSQSLLVQILDSDTTSPLITSATAGFQSNGWYSSDVTVNWTIDDPESPVYSYSGCQPLSNPGDGITTTDCRATSSGGTSITTLLLRIDSTAPEVTISSPASGASYLVGEQVLAQWQAIDSPIATASGIDLINATNENGMAIDTSTAGTFFFNVQANDLANNVTLAKSLYTVKTVSQATTDLIVSIDDLDLKPRVNRKLIKRLEKVIQLVSKDRTSKANKELDKFIRTVNRQTDRDIDPITAQLLIGEAERLKR